MSFPQWCLFPSCEQYVNNWSADFTVIVGCLRKVMVEGLHRLSAIVSIVFVLPNTRGLSSPRQRGLNR